MSGAGSADCRENTANRCKLQPKAGKPLSAQKHTCHVWCALDNELVKQRMCHGREQETRVYSTDQWPKVPIDTFRETSQLYMHRQLRDEIQVRRKDRWRASEWSGRASVFYLFYICKLSLTSGMKPVCKITAGQTVCGNVHICCWISKVQIIRIRNTGPTQSRQTRRGFFIITKMVSDCSLVVVTVNKV